MVVLHMIEHFVSVLYPVAYLNAWMEFCSLAQSLDIKNGDGTSSGVLEYGH